MPSPIITTVVARSLFLLDEVGFVLRQNLGVELVHAHLLGNGLGGAVAVTGHHHGVRMPSLCSWCRTEAASGRRGRRCR